MERFLEYEIQVEADEDIEVSVGLFPKEKAVAVLVEAKDLPVWRDYKQTFKPMRGQVELTPQSPVGRLTIPETGKWYVLIQTWDTNSAKVERVPRL